MTRQRAPQTRTVNDHQATAEVNVEQAASRKSRNASTDTADTPAAGPATHAKSVAPIKKLASGGMVTVPT